MGLNCKRQNCKKDKIARRQIFTKGQFCTRVKNKKIKIFKKTKGKKSYWPRVRVSGNSGRKRK